MFADLIGSANFFVSAVELYNLKGFKYLTDFLEVNNCSFVIVEDGYISETYLQEFEHYYCTEYKSNHKFTTRIHFFKSIEGFVAIDLQTFIRLDTQKVNEEYLGHIVIKPVANSFWGVTMLKSSKIQYEGKSVCKSTVIDTVHILNQKFTIETLPFQRQDSAISECARASIWSCLYYSHKKFRKDYFSIVSLSKIVYEETQDVTANKEGSVYLGLNVTQINKIVTKFGLRLHSFTYVANKLHENATTLFNAVENKVEKRRLAKNYTWENEDIMNEFKDNIYAYNKSGLPILLGYKIERFHDDSIEVKESDRYHLVTVVGYNVDERDKQIYGEGINRIYVHDDQFGPFSILEPSEIPNYSNQIGKKRTFKAQEIEGDYIDVIPTHVYVPVPKDVTIHYKNIMDFRKEFLVIFRLMFNQTYVNKILNPLDDIQKEYPNIVINNYLIKGSNYKNQALNYLTDEDNIGRYNFSESLVQQISNLALPRFVWILEYSINSIKLCEVIIDTTCVKESFSFIGLIIYDNFLVDKLRISELEFKQRLVFGIFNHTELVNHANKGLINSIKKFLLYNITHHEVKNFNEEYMHFHSLKYLNFNYQSLDSDSIVSYIETLDKDESTDLVFLSREIHSFFEQLSVSARDYLMISKLIQDRYLNVHLKEDNSLYGIEIESGLEEKIVFSIKADTLNHL